MPLSMNPALHQGRNSDYAQELSGDEVRDLIPLCLSVRRRGCGRQGCGWSRECWVEAIYAHITFDGGDNDSVC